MGANEKIMKAAQMELCDALDALHDEIRSKLEKRKKSKAASCLIGSEGSQKESEK